MTLRWSDLPFRRKILILILANIILGGLFVILIGTRLEHRTIMSLAQTRIFHDLVSARAVYASIAENMTTVVTVAAERDAFRLRRPGTPDPGLGALLARMAKIGRLDFLSFSDATGQVIARSDPYASTGDSWSLDPFFQKLVAGLSFTATRRLPRESLQRESPGLALPDTGLLLILAAGAPVRDRDGRVTGVLYAGRRISGDNTIVDKIKATVFEGFPSGDDDGAVSIYMDDVRAATTLLDAEGARITGTHSDPGLFRDALRHGKLWQGRARVFEEWYIAASEPLLDHDGTAAGTLILGLRERPFIVLRNALSLKFASLGILGALILLFLLIRLTGRLVRPLGEVAAAASRVAQGDLNLRLEVDSRDEIGELGAAFNRMTSELRKAKANLLQWTWTLEGQVVERNRALRNIQDSMARSEKLASLGQLSAGIAHEINNPLTSVLLNVHLLLERTTPDDPAAAALRLIAEETERCANIVKGLLDYSRRTPPERTSVDLNSLIERTVALLSGQAWARNIRIIPNLDPALPPLPMEAAKIQQVFWNLILNSCEAMPAGGEIIISTRRSSDRKSIEVVFADSGPGIPAEIAGRIFDPFFTTKPAGTGLGLAVAGGIVEQHGGRIFVGNEAGRGAVFTVQWPLPETENGNRGRIP